MRHIDELPRRERKTTNLSMRTRSRDKNDLLKRQQIIEAMIKALKPLEYVHAFWEGGAAAFGRVDEWSDIDAYLLVDDAKIADAFLEVEKALESVSPIRQKYVVSQNWPGVTQAFYSLKRASEYVLVDLGILTDTSPEKFLEPEIHGKVIFYFDKTGITETPRLDHEKFDLKVIDRSRVLKERFRMFGKFVQKELNRDNGLEALEYYRTIVITSLVEALRIKYYPVHYDFKMRYIHYELPPKVVKRLENLCFVRGKEDLQEKYSLSSEWFDEIMKEVPDSSKHSLRQN
jgi:predicted nucleotidyltransferase